MPPTNTVEARKTSLTRLLRKRERKTLTAMAREMGVPVKGLTVPISRLVTEGSALRHPGVRGESPTYTKP